MQHSKLPGKAPFASFFPSCTKGLSTSYILDGRKHYVITTMRYQYLFKKQGLRCSDINNMAQLGCYRIKHLLQVQFMEIHFELHAFKFSFFHCIKIKHCLYNPVVLLQRLVAQQAVAPIQISRNHEDVFILPRKAVQMQHFDFTMENTYLFPASLLAGCFLNNSNLVSKLTSQ